MAEPWCAELTTRRQTAQVSRAKHSFDPSLIAHRFGARGILGEGSVSLRRA